MLIPVAPTVAFIGFAAVAARYASRKQWLKGVICLPGGFVPFGAIRQLTGRSPHPDQELTRIAVLEQRVSAREAQVQRLQLTSENR